MVSRTHIFRSLGAMSLVPRRTNRLLSDPEPPVAADCFREAIIPTRTYLKTSKLPEEDADARELDEAEEVDRVVLPTNQ
jgi:hypothetical protein